MIRKILIAFDGSDHATKALAIASEIAPATEARFIIGHVLMRDASIETVRKLTDRGKLSRVECADFDRFENQILSAVRGNAFADLLPVAVPDSLLEAMGQQLLERAVAKARSAKVKDVTSVILRGNTADAIQAWARSERADLLALGSRGFGEIKGLFLGSVSQQLVVRAPCACLTVK